MSVYYTLATIQNNILTAIPADVYANLGVPEQELHYSTVVPEVLGIPDTGEGMFLAPDNHRYFMGCFSRLQQLPRNKSYYLSDEYYDRVRWLLHVWLALSNQLDQPVYLVWS